MQSQDTPNPLASPLGFDQKLDRIISVLELIASKLGHVPSSTGQLGYNIAGGYNSPCGGYAEDSSYSSQEGGMPR